jgi:hypothetical protein
MKQVPSPKIFGRFKDVGKGGQTSASHRIIMGKIYNE